MLGQLGEDLGREQVDLFGHLEAGEKTPDEKGQVLEPLAQRRHVHADDGEAEVEVLAKTPAVHLALEVPVRRRDDADVDLARLDLAEAPDLARLEGAQELRLQLDGKLADLVEEDGSPVGRFERADPVALGPGERAAHVTEELTLDEVRRDGSAVDDDEGPLAARAALEDLGRDELLAGAALAFDEHVDVARRDLLEHREELAHGDARADERTEPLSCTRQTAPSRVSLQWKRDTAGSRRTRSFEECVPMRQTSPWKMSVRSPCGPSRFTSMTSLGKRSIMLPRTR